MARSFRMPQSAIHRAHPALHTPRSAHYPPLATRLPTPPATARGLPMESGGSNKVGDEDEAIAIIVVVYR